MNNIKQYNKTNFHKVSELLANVTINNKIKYVKINIKKILKNINNLELDNILEQERMSVLWDIWNTHDKCHKSMYK